jgi:hypothetical protein
MVMMIRGRLVAAISRSQRRKATRENGYITAVGTIYADVFSV